MSLGVAIVRRDVWGVLVERAHVMGPSLRSQGVGAIPEIKSPVSGSA